MVLDDLNSERVIAVTIAVAAVLLAFVFYFAMRFISRTQGDGRTFGWVHAATRSVARTGAVFILVGGWTVGLLTWPEAADWHDNIGRVGSVALILIGARGVTKVANAILNWYGETWAASTVTHLDDRMLPFVRRVIPVTCYGIGFLIALDTLGLSISPLLGGLGLSGLAVALGLQPTLSNFFAGTNVISEGAFSQGDYIELQGGPAGYVQSVGLRSTRVRTWLNNEVIVPNSLVANSIMVNYSRPDPRMNVLVTCGVSYDSDLQRVNEVALEVARETIAANPEAEKEEPWFGYERFGDSNIDFWVFLQAKDRVGSFIVTNDLIKRLHARFQQEGIEINYPVRKVVFDSPAPPGATPGAEGR